MYVSMDKSYFFIISNTTTNYANQEIDAITKEKENYKEKLITLKFKDWQRRVILHILGVLLFVGLFSLNFIFTSCKHNYVYKLTMLIDSVESKFIGDCLKVLTGIYLIPLIFFYKGIKRRLCKTSRDEKKVLIKSKLKK